MDHAVCRLIDTDTSASLRLHAAELLELAARTRHPATACHLEELAMKCMRLALEVEQARDGQAPAIAAAALALYAVRRARGRGSQA